MTKQPLADDISRCHGNVGDKQCHDCQRFERNEMAIHWYLVPHLIDGECVHKIGGEVFKLEHEK